MLANKHRKDRNCFWERSRPPDESLKIYPKFHVRPIFARASRPGYMYICAGDAPRELKPRGRGSGYPGPCALAFYCWQEELLSFVKLRKESVHGDRLKVLTRFSLQIFGGISFRGTVDFGFDSRVEGGRSCIQF